MLMYRMLKRDAIARCLYVRLLLPPSVCHKPVVYENG